MLHVILARCFGMPPQTAMSWLLGARLIEQVTAPEWQFITRGEGDHRSFVLHLEALFALAWVLGLTKQLDPTVPPDARPPGVCRTWPAARPSTSGAPGPWPRRGTRPTRRPLLDLLLLPGLGVTWRRSGRGAAARLIDSNAIGQRRWALEWAVVFRGPYHDDPPAGWEEVDLST